MVLIRRADVHQRLRALLVEETVPSDASLDDTVAAVRRELTGLREALARAAADNTILWAVADASPLGMVALGPDGQELLRNPSAGELSSPEAALIRQAIDGLIAKGKSGPVREVIDLVGPPRRSLEVTVQALHGAERFHHSHDPVADQALSKAPFTTTTIPASSSNPTRAGTGAATSVTQPVLGSVAFVADVTEKRRIDAVRRDFILNISHELRTPVGAIAILAETLTDETDPETAKRLTGRLEQESHRLAIMVDDLLSLTRVEAEDGVEYSSVAVADLFDKIVERSGSAAELRGISVEIGGGSDLRVLGDRRQLVSALTNLVDNAMKYSGENSVVTLDAHRVQSEARSLIELRVTDHGIGIPPRERERIFERFYRVDKARARDTGGTGLGLAIVRHVAVNHGGSVRVDSLEGIGSTFVLVIPEA
jgi:two-component system, OmpR family, sensor histidine kinase SenX3